jgi:hypothetical protein
MNPTAGLDVFWEEKNLILCSDSSPAADQPARSLGTIVTTLSWLLIILPDRFQTSLFTSQTHKVHTQSPRHHLLAHISFGNWMTLQISSSLPYCLSAPSLS